MFLKLKFDSLSSWYTVERYSMNQNLKDENLMNGRPEEE